MSHECIRENKYNSINRNAPIQLAICLYLLYRQIGPTAFVALGVLFASILPQAKVSSIISSFAKETAKFADDRVKLINEVFSGIRIVKLMAWESSFTSKILAVRFNELILKRKSAIMGALTSTIMMASPLIVALATFPIYSSLYGMTPGGAFSALTLFNILRLPLMVIPMLIMNIATANASIDRLALFLSSPDMIDYREEISLSFSAAVEFVDATFGWVRADGLEIEETSDGSDEPIRQDPVATLHNLTLSIPKGKLTVVAGSVGSGKSSLLSALLGEMESWSGTVSLSESRSSIAYAAQQPFILNATLRENILFGLDEDRHRYQAVLDACALLPDLEVLPAGDETEIGEKGVSLSGGQKARVSLARALYSSCPLVLLDDPLSAVDAHVAKYLIDKVLCGNLLNGRTVILVTHQIAIATPVADFIVIMDAGKIVQKGSFDELKGEKDSHFNRMMSIASIKMSVPKEESESSSVLIKNDIKTSASNDKCLSSSMDKTDKSVSKIMTDEDRLRGGVPSSVYLMYLYSLGSTPLAVIAITLAAVNVGSVSIDWFLGLWSTDELSASVDFYIGVYAAIVIGTIFVNFVEYIAWAVGGIISAKKLHDQMLTRVLRAPTSFFDTTPLGRIINRFSTDVATIDVSLPASFSSYMNLTSKILSTIVVQGIILKFTFIAYLPIGILYYLIQAFYRNSSRELKRLDATSKSPIYAHIAETLSGLTTIRAYGGDSRFLKECQIRIDSNNRAVYISNLINRWLGLRLDWIGAILVGTTGITAVTTAGRVNSGLIGLAIAYSLSITGLLNWMVRGSTETETHLASVERMQHYSSIAVERPPVVSENRPGANWPSQGVISVRNLTVRYRPELAPVLKNVSFDVMAGHKIGVCGRTGSGKSSLMLALFRIIEADEEGSIEIDGINIGSIGLDDLRSRLAIIPQDPTLFAGTLRYNLDPLGERTDEELVSTMLNIEGLQVAADSVGGLEGTISDGGENLSVGQRQLVCLCRAVLRQSKILVLDEATASVDGKTDDMIQKMLRTEVFARTTILVIAHRINTIIDCDRVLVLENGAVSEYGSPKELLKKQGGSFASLVERSEGNIDGLAT